jgi:hypothetical protein
MPSAQQAQALIRYIAPALRIPLGPWSAQHGPLYVGGWEGLFRQQVFISRHQRWPA